jgi:hypothetical protein
VRACTANRALLAHDFHAAIAKFVDATKNYRPTPTVVELVFGGGGRKRIYRA